MAPPQVFVQQIAFLEGLKDITPAKETLPVTLENVHARLNALERSAEQPNPQPPTVVPDWDSLRYRTMRLWRAPVRCPGVYALVVSADQWWPSAEQTGDQATALALERTLRSLGILSYSAPLRPDAKEDGGKDGDSCPSSSGSDQFDMAAQEFCRLAGKHRKKPLRPYQSMRELYAAAFELNLVLEGRHAHPSAAGAASPGMNPRTVHVERLKRPKKKVSKEGGGFLQFMSCGSRDDSDSDSGSDSDDDSVCAKKGWRRWLPDWLYKGHSKKRRCGWDTDSSSGDSTLAD
ncbi:hypothetical protein PG994_009879 [Apiospora phragmitis]|uniref:Uncharacterized protein n=1 Tax=Apiospora phragmitis TaxID=2905665 RepID=A0ABR1TNA8_9PEZI